jgi:hypothetical protein
MMPLPEGPHFQPALTSIKAVWEDAGELAGPDSSRLIHSGLTSLWQHNRRVRHQLELTLKAVAYNFKQG